ncbi:MAG TPA: hypothetical protein DCE78_00510 [Bacteroidetes bacterium]|nr:hypothetical protein [Bacteroidota bacterium]
MEKIKINAAIILAAGKNTRFDTGVPKSLHQLGEFSLLERQIREFHKAHIFNIAVVVGYRGHILKSYIEKLNNLLILPVEIIENPEFDKANGYSILAAKNWVRSLDTDLFLCTMADHVFEESFFHNFIRKLENLGMVPNRIRPDPCLLNLAVDLPGEHNAYIDILDVTRVYAEQKSHHDICIHKAAKLMEEFNYFDTGFFALRKEVFEFLEKLTDEGKDSITDLVNHLADRQEARAIDMSGYYWNDIDTPEDFKIVQSQINKLKPKI